jgi:hypothetical protein
MSTSATSLSASEAPVPNATDFDVAGLQTWLVRALIATMTRIIMAPRPIGVGTLGPELFSVRPMFPDVELMILIHVAVGVSHRYAAYIERRILGLSNSQTGVRGSHQNGTHRRDLPTYLHCFSLSAIPPRWKAVCPNFWRIFGMIRPKVRNNCRIAKRSAFATFAPVKAYPNGKFRSPTRYGINPIERGSASAMHGT